MRPSPRFSDVPTALYIKMQPYLSCRVFFKFGHLFSGKPPKWIDYPNPNRCEEGFSNICNRTYASDQTDTWCLKDIYICDGHRHSIDIRTVTHCAFSSNLFHGQIAQIYINHLSGPENKKCSP